MFGACIEGIKRGFVHDDRVFGQPSLGVVPVLDVLVGFGVVAGGARRHVAFNHASGHGLREFCGLNRDRLCAHQFRNTGCGGAVGAPFHTLQIGCRVDGLLHIDALRWPSHCIQQHHALLAQFLLKEGALYFVQFERFFVAVCQEGQAICTKQLPFILEIGQQDFTNLCLATLYGTLDFGCFEQRGVGMNRDFQLTARSFFNIVGKLHQVFGVEVVGGVGRGQVPLGLGLS